jgi:hypothetical protein
MTNRDTLAQLPRAYALALRLRAAGVDDELIADCLDIEPAAVSTLLRVAAAKVAHVPTDSHEKRVVPYACHRGDASVPSDV